MDPCIIWIGVWTFSNLVLILHENAGRLIFVFLEKGCLDLSGKQHKKKGRIIFLDG